MVETAKAADKLNVFISYSRDDLEFADQLDASLQLGGFDTTIDRRGMSGGEDWKVRLGALIRDADTVVFVLSPSSAHSDICAWEVAEAVHLGKRVIPVLCRTLGDARAPQQLADRDYIYFYPEPKFPGSGFGPGLLRLAAALNTDPDWLREHTRYLRLAKEWEEVGKPPDRRLLSAPDIALARDWAKSRPTKAPELTQLQLEFITASEAEDNRLAKAKAAAARQAAERTARRKAVIYRSAIAVSVLTLLGISYYALTAASRQRAEREKLQAQLAQVQERRIVSLARDAFLTDGPAAAILIASEVHEKHLPAGPEAERVVLLSLRQLRERTVLTGHKLPLVGVDFAPSGQIIVTADSKNLFFWKSDDGSKLSSIDLSKLNSIDLRPFGPISGVQWSPRGDQIAVASRDQTRLLSPCSINELKKILAGDCVGEGETQSFIIGTGEKKAGKAKFSQDDRWLVTGSVGEYPKRWHLDTKTGEALGPDLEYQVKMASPSANGFALSGGDKSVIAVGDTSGTIQVFDVASGAKMLTLEAPPNSDVNGNVISLAFNPYDPAMLAAAFEDGSLLVWKDWN